MRRRTLLFIVLLMFGVKTLPAQDGAVSGKMHSRFRISFAPVISFYKYPKEYVVNSKRKSAFDISLLYEFCFSRFSGIMLGVEFLHHGMTFDSYYFAPGYSYLYDKKYDYHHTVSINELHVPLLFRLSDGKESQRGFTMYACGGWVYRYFLPSYVMVERPGGGPPLLVDKFTDLQNEYSLFSRQDGSILQAGAGLQRNNRTRTKSAFLELMFRWPIARFIYAETGKNSAMYIRDPNISIGVGFRL